MCRIYKKTQKECAMNRGGGFLFQASIESFIFLFGSRRVRNSYSHHQMTFLIITIRVLYYTVNTAANMYVRACEQDCDSTFAFTTQQEIFPILPTFKANPHSNKQK